MSSIHFTDTVTHLPAEWANDVDALVYDIFSAAQTRAEALVALGLRGMALQSPESVNITGGNINGVQLGTLNAVPFAVIDILTLQQDPVADEQAVRLGYMKSFVDSEVDDKISVFSSSLGDMAWQNANNIAVIGGVLDNVTIGGSSPANGKFINLKMTSSPSQGDDVITLGWLQAAYGPLFSSIKSMAFQEDTAVDINGGTIDGVDIGNDVPGSGIFSVLQTATAPTSNNDVTNKLYVDNTVATLISGLGTMAYQNHGAVNILGGTIQNTVIGSSFPNTGRFTQVQIDNNQASLFLRAGTAVPASAEARISFQEALVERGLITLVGASNTAYDASLQGSLYIQAAATLTLQGYSAVATLTDLNGLHVKHGTPIANPLTITTYTPSITAGAITGAVKRGSVRLYGSAVDFGTIQQSATSMHVDAGSIVLNGIGTGTILLNGAAPVLGSERAQALDGLYANVLRSQTASFGNVGATDTGLLLNGVTIKRANMSGAEPNSTLRIANAKQAGSTFLQDTLAVDFCAGTDTAVGTKMAQIRVPTEGSDPSFNIRVYDSATLDLEHIAAFYKVGMVLDKDGIAKGWHSFYESALGVTGAVNLDMGLHTVFYQNIVGAVTYTFSNVPALPGVMQRFELYVYQGTGGAAITLPAGVYWATQVPNFAGAPIGQTDVIDLVTFNSGTTWVASWRRGRPVPYGGTVGHVLTRVAGSADPYAWQAGGG
jgi:hypothetical protein